MVICGGGLCPDMHIAKYKYIIKHVEKRKFEMDSLQELFWGAGSENLRIGYLPPRTAPVPKMRGILRRS